jgi:DNA-binding Lrp family transcriptional regulator
MIVAARLDNYRAFGDNVYNIFFDLPSKTTLKALEFLKERQEVVWLTRNIGPHKFEVTFVASEYSGIIQILNDLGEESRAHLLNPVFAIESEARHWGLRFLAENYDRKPVVHFKKPESPREVDLIDRKIMRALHGNSSMSPREMSVKLELAENTARYRLERLRDCGAISDALYFSVGTQNFVQAQIVINLKSRTRQHEDEILDICCDVPYVEGLITGLGSWDFKIIIRADTLNRLIEIEESILGALRKNIARASIYLRNKVIATY